MLVKFSKIKAILLLAFAVPTLMAYITFNLYLEATGREVVETFLKMESLEIQQGNLISSLSKGQNFLFSSRFISGIKLHDVRTGYDQITLGKEFHFQRPKELPENKPHLEKVGFLHSHIFYFIKDKGLILIFEVQSRFLTLFFFVAVAILGLLLGASFFTFHLVRKKEEQKRMDFMYGITRRVRHDVSSRLFTIKTIAETSKSMASEEKSTQLSCCYQIDDMLRDLNYDEDMPEILGEIPLHFAALVKFAYKEAVIKNRNREKISWKLNLDRDALDLCLEYHSHGLLRSLHNLLDNAVESIRGEGEISLTLRKKQNEIIFEIQDTGMGIPQNEIHKVGTHKFSTKEKGQGLGVYHAKKCLKKTWRNHCI